MKSKRVIRKKRNFLINKEIVRKGAFFIPLFLLLLLLYLYFLPLGFYKKISYSFGETLNDTRDLSFTIDNLASQESDNPSLFLDGIMDIEYHPSINKKGIDLKISIEGENVYIIPKKISEKDKMDIWDYELNLDDTLFEGDRYLLLDNYTVKESDFITFSLDFKKDTDEAKYPQILLKHDNLKIILYEYYVEVIVNQIVDSDLLTYTAQYSFTQNELDNRNNIVVSFKKPDSDNGYIEIYCNDKLGQRTFLPSNVNLLSTDLYTNENYVTWSNNLIKDLSQKYISLGQESFAEELLSNYSKELKATVDLQRYYANLYEPVIEKDEEEDNLQYSGDWDDYFKIDDNNYFHLTQIFYPKIFYNYFSGDIYTLKIGYIYPFTTKISSQLKDSDTPTSFLIYGDKGILKNISIIASEEAIWKR